MPFGRPMEKLEWCEYPTVKKSEDMCNHFDRKPACDRQTSCDGTVRTVYSIAW